MHCSKASELMSLRLDGLLEGAAETDLDAHLASCARCKEEWEALCEVSRIFRSTPLIAPRPGFAKRVSRRLAQRMARRKRRRQVLLLSVGLSLLLLLAMPSLLRLGMLLGDLAQPTLISTGIRALAGLISALEVLRDAVTLVISALLSTPAVFLAPAYAGLALAAIYAWVRLALRTQPVSQAR